MMEKKGGKSAHHSCRQKVDKPRENKFIVRLHSTALSIATRRRSSFQQGVSLLSFPSRRVRGKARENRRSKMRAAGSSSYLPCCFSGPARRDNNRLALVIFRHKMQADMTPLALNGCQETVGSSSNRISGQKLVEHTTRTTVGYALFNFWVTVQVILL